MTDLERIKIAIQALISLGIGKNQEDIGKLLGYTNKSSFSQVVNGKVALPKDFIDKLCGLHRSISKVWLISGVGNVLRDASKSKQVYKQFEDNINLVNESIENEYNSNIGIPLIPVDAMAGIASGDIQIMEYEAERFIIPTFKGADYLISVKGSSMYPKYNSGDIVACKQLSIDTFFQWNKVYVLDTEQGALIKRICKSDIENHVKIVSDNKSYDPFDLHLQKIRSIAIVIGVIRLE